MQKGFTFIEFLLYIGIVGVVLTVAGAIGLNVLFGKAKLIAIEEVSQNARFTMEKITESIRSAQQINSPTQGATSSTLSLQMADAAKNPTVFTLASGILQIQESTGAVVDLTSSEVVVSALQFSNISYPNTPGAVRIEMTLQFTNPENRQEYRFEETFYTTTNIRVKP